MDRIRVMVVADDLPVLASHVQWSNNGEARPRPDPFLTFELLWLRSIGSSER